MLSQVSERGSLEAAHNSRNLSTALGADQQMQMVVQQHVAKMAEWMKSLGHA